MRSNRFRPALAGSLFALALVSGSAVAATVTFQSGVSAYAGAVDTWIGGAAPTADNSASAVVEWDGDDGGAPNYGLLRFDGIFGAGANQVPAGASISSATLTYTVTNGGGSAYVNEVAVDWAPPSPVTWNTFGGDAGLQSDEYGTLVGTALGTLGTQTLNVTSSVAAWSVTPTSNRGWVFRPTGGTDGVQFVSSESTTVASRPLLTVTYTLQTGVDLSPASVSAVVGQADVSAALSIPPGSNASGPVHVTLTSSNPASVVPVGAVGGALVVTFAQGGPTAQTIAIDILQAGNATISSTNDAGLTDDTISVSVGAGAVNFTPGNLLAGAGMTVPMKVAITAGSNDTRPVTVTVTTANPSIAAPVGASGGVLSLVFAQGAANWQFINVVAVAVGSTTFQLGNDGGLANGATAPVSIFDGFNFTATADPRDKVTEWDGTLAGIQGSVTNLGAFQVSPGDIDPPTPLRNAMDARFGPAALWYPNVGNHEVETASDMVWVRAEYTSGNGVRTPLKNFTNQDGPAGSVETTFSWNYGNAHFISLNEYWNGGTATGSDVAVDGDIVTALYNWLAADLAANTKPVVFVFGHEPAYPFNRHVGDSLDKYPAHRDAFWSLLQSYGVQAYICGHTHVYSRYQPTVGGTWQIDLGNAGNAEDATEGQTFLNAVVTATQVRYDIWRNATGSWAKSDTWTAPVGIRLSVSPTSFSPSVHVGAVPPADTFTVSPIGPGSTTYTVTVDGSPSWMNVSPTSGTSSGAPVSHTITYSTASLVPGTYTATIRVTDPAAINSPRTVPVSLTVRPVKGDFDLDGDVDQTDYGHLQYCLTGEMMPPTDPTCSDALLDGDTDVDGNDVAVFLNCLGGANMPVPVTCP